MTLLQDIRFALRVLLKEKAFAAVVVVVLALGIGANATVFTLVNAVLFRGLPFEDSSRIMHLTGSNPSKGRERIGVSWPEYKDWRDQAKSFSGLAAFTGGQANLSDRNGPPERYAGARISTNTFRLLGIQPALGRDFGPTDEKPGGPAVALIGYGIWKDRYGLDRSILGRNVRINEVPTTIIGVLPEGMKFPFNNDVWFPLTDKPERARRDDRDLSVCGRLAPGTTLPGARAEMEIIARHIEKDYPKTNRGVGVLVKPFNDEVNGGPIRVMFLALLGAVGFVLLIACANVANLLLSRSLARAREMSIRAALGASRWRIVRQLLVESVLLSMTGGLLGLMLARWGVRAFDLAVADVGKPYWIQFTMDLTVFGYVAGICVLTGILFGLAPALQAAKVDLNEALKEGARGAGGALRARYLTGGLVVVELALSMVLLIGAGLMIRSFLKMYVIHSEMAPESILTLRLNLADAKYPKPEQRLAFYERLEPRLRSIPGVEAVSFTTNTPMGGAMGWHYDLEDKPVDDVEKRPTVSGLAIGGDYFKALGVTLVRGRAFTANDGLPGQNTAIVNQRFAAKVWPGGDAIGKRLRLYWNEETHPVTVVGVTPDIRQDNPVNAEIAPVVYVPLREQPTSGMSLVARTRTAPATLATAFRKEVQVVDEDMPVFTVRSLLEGFQQSRWHLRVFGSLFAIFAGIALLLASVGIYAVMAYSVGRRTQEIGVRMALGAGTRSVLGLVFASGLKQLAMGLVIGLAAAFGITRAIASLLVQVKPADPLTFGVVSAVLSAAALLACWIPARRALRVDPVVALRYE